MAIKLKVELLHVQPKIWRRVIVPVDLTLDGLHAVIQGAMGWEDAHLHAFAIGRRRFAVPMDDDPFDDAAEEDEREHRLADVLKPRLKFVYTYDFGDDWDHRVTVEDMAAEDGGTGKPHCVAGARACPPEDCGGPYGYAELVDVLADVRHSSHKELSEFYGEIDPAAFDLAAANRRIAAMFGARRRRV